VKRRRKIQLTAAILISALAVTHFQAVNASTMNKAKNEKKKAAAEKRGEQQQER